MSSSEYILCENCGTKVMYTELAVLDETRPIVVCVKCFRQLQARIKKLEEALKKYGEHSITCEKHPEIIKDPAVYECGCGLEQALKEE